MTDSPLLNAVLTNLDHRAATQSQWPDSKGEYWALCPFHRDTHVGSFSVSERGFRCFACGAKGGLRALAEHLGVAGLHAFPDDDTPPPPSLTVEQYAQAKGLDVAFLESLGLETVYVQGKPCLKIPYYDAEGNEVAARLRLARTGDLRFRWRKGSKTHPYGLWKLHEAKETGHIILVEGESDAHTLWRYGIPALGVPGATTWKAEWGDYLAGLTVYLWQEPDDGGATFAQKISASLPGGRIITAPEGRKDVSECHILGDDVPALMQRLMAEAKPWAALQARAVSREANEARHRAESLLSAPDILAKFDALLTELGLVGENRNAKLLFLALTSRLLDRPISAVVKGPSSAGKSYTVETVLKAFPESAYLDFTSMSEHALVYDDRPVAHRFIVLYEASGLGRDAPGESNALAYCVRSLLSEGRMRYTTVEKGEEGMRPRHIERDGPTGLITTTTWASLHPENETRLLSLTVRDDRVQTAAIFQALADRYNGNGRREPDLTPWHALQTWLELAGERRVTIPYAHELAAKANSGAVRMRRDLNAVFAAVTTHAILHQCSRERDDRGRIIATPEDYRAVYELLGDVVAEGIEATVSPTVRQTVEAVADLLEERNHEPVQVARLAQRLGLDKSTALRRVRVATKHGYLVNTETQRGRPAKLVLGDTLPEERPALPTPESLGSRGEGGTNPPATTATVQPLEQLMAQGLTRAEAELVAEYEGAA